MVTVSPPVSPSVVAAILRIQKTSVTSGTLVAYRSSAAVILSPVPTQRFIRLSSSTVLRSRLREHPLGYCINRPANLAAVESVSVARLTVQLLLCSALLAAIGYPAKAGPPYLSDDPEPTDYRHFEIYTFSNGVATQEGITGEGGIDFNYGGAPNLQLSATLPVAYDFAVSGPALGGLGNIELAAKYRFLTQESFGLDVAIFPRVFLPSVSSNVGEQHASFLLPVWLEKDWGQWSAFGGGGCEVNRGGDSQDFCLAGVVG